MIGTYEVGLAGDRLAVGTFQRARSQVHQGRQVGLHVILVILNSIRGGGLAAVRKRATGMWRP